MRLALGAFLPRQRGHYCLALPSVHSLPIQRHVRDLQLGEGWDSIECVDWKEWTDRLSVD